MMEIRPGGHVRYLTGHGQPEFRVKSKRKCANSQVLTGARRYSQVLAGARHVHLATSYGSTQLLFPQNI